MTESGLWTLDELCELAEQALAKEARGPLDGRVREVPDRRTFRYYSSLGLIDRPAEMRGRTACYTHKHLWQLLAIKRLQARGLSLLQIQQSMLGLGEIELRRLAGVPDEPSTHQKETRDNFWRTTPAPVELAPPPESPVMQGVRLAAGVTLLLETLRDMRDEDREALRLAAAPLLELLRTRGLIDDNGERL